ncbi:CHAT domain-containing protein [Streptomyces canus]|uniref:CHAT domain-containing protein n=1 Tax=Streptomyces canus TaxID=58343 RepID=UPI0022592680|nr:CHAT domain-containing protein [Streptomyces canus]MCX4856814.1 CHAT domain-containing protein [Streptomyces canus]WSW37797.1 CHAT domain-containing protein [Streptomyces canus]
MSISVFDPFRGNARQELPDWLAQRNRSTDDEAIIEYVLPLSALFGRNVGFGTRLSVLPLIARSWRVIRQARSEQSRIGLHECDLMAAQDRVLWRRVLPVRAAVVALVLTACLLLSPPGWAVLWFPVTAWALTGWRRPPAATLLVAVLAWAAWQQPTMLVSAVPAAALVALVRLMLSMQELGLISSASSGSPVSFLGQRFLLRTLWDSRAASVALAVDKATHDDRARTACFIDETPDSVPHHLRPVVVQCQALATLAALEFRSAMVLSEEARTLAAGSPPEIRGWCALQAGDVLLAAGQPAAAEVRWREAMKLLERAPRSQYWAAEAELRMIEALTTDPADTARCVDGLQILCRTRHSAIRGGNLTLLSKTELYLLRLMHEAGNTVGVVEQLAAQYERREGKSDLAASVSEHAAEVLLLATLYLDVIENPDRYPDTMRVDEDGRHERYVYAAALMDNVLRQLSRSKMPHLQAQAYAVLAHIQRAAGMREEALGNALESLHAIQHVRYQLPTTQWRAHWITAHAHVYALALDLAESDPALVAELLEIVRAQSVPVESDEPGVRLRAVLDALVSSTGLPLGAGGAQDGEQSADPRYSDPLLTDRTVLVEHASWVGGEESNAIDLDGELDLMFPGGWYWSYARAGEWIYHAVRTPSGDWHSERRPHAQLADHFKDLVLHLPVKVPGAERIGPRIRSSALAATGADDPVRGYLTAGQVWTRIFDGLGAAMIPTVLREALTVSSTPLPLVLAPTGALALVPVCALPVTPGRDVMDVAQLSYLPSIALLSQRRRLTVQEGGDPRHRIDSEPSRVLSVLAPHSSSDPKTHDLPHAMAGIPQHSEVAPRPLTKFGFADLVKRHGIDDTVLYLAGHVESEDKEDPGSTGFTFDDGPLALHDFYRTDDSGAPLYSMPDRVMLAACASLGLYGRPESGYAPSLLDVPEWLGLGAAVIHGGARHVYCTLFQIPDTEHTARIDLALVDALRHHTEPASALRAVQRAELRRWRNGSGSLPLAFLAYAYVGLGAAPGQELPVAPNADERPEYVPAARRPQAPRQEPPAARQQPQDTAESLEQPTAARTEPAVRPRPRTRKTYEPFMMMSRHTHDGAGLSDQLRPRFGQDGRLLLTSYDGEVSEPVPVRLSVWTKENFDFSDLSTNSETEWRVRDASLLLTDARLVLVVDKRDAQGRTLAGHIRHPWISSVAFRPKQSFLNDCELVIQCQQDTEHATASATYYRLTLILDRETDSGELARRLVRRLARHHLDHGMLPNAARPLFEALRDPPRLPAPDKGDHATYALPAFKNYPEGVEYLLDQPVEGTWIGPGLTPAD